MLGSFILLEFADPNLSDLLHLEGIDSMTVRDDTEMIARYLDRFAELERLSLSEDESIDFIDMLMDEMSSIEQSEDSTPREAVYTGSNSP
jgi:hypothetical protein